MKETTSPHLRSLNWAEALQSKYWQSLRSNGTARFAAHSKATRSGKSALCRRINWSW